MDMQATLHGVLINSKQTPAMLSGNWANLVYISALDMKMPLDERMGPN